LRRPELTDAPDHGTPDIEASKDPARSVRLGVAGIRVDYSPTDVAASSSGVLAAIRFGAATEAPAPPAAPLSIHVRLDPGTGLIEYWRATGPVTHGHSGSIRYASDAHHLFAVSELDEREHGGVLRTAQTVYEELRRFQQQSEFPHLLRIWNYMDAINGGDGDEERYRQFCVGRLRGLGDAKECDFPAASALGHQHATRRLQVYWLASRAPGKHFENPRQVSAYRYPRTHGPVSPSFARATLSLDGTLLISGTASIVGHVSQHVGDPLAQLDEIVRNLATLGATPDGKEPPENCMFKIYVRDCVHIDVIRQRLHAAFPHCPMVILAADICRKELLLEIEAIKLTPPTRG
jgi:chorismate lyase/3-hydroxybenzoate synthase